MSKSNVTIVGAGIAGLTAGLRLAERGYQVLFYERDWLVRGKFRAFEWIQGDKSPSFSRTQLPHVPQLVSQFLLDCR